MAKSAIGTTTLVLGVAALGLAAIPGILFDVPHPWAAGRPEPAVRGQKSIEWRGLKLKWGGKPVEADPAGPVRMTPAKGFALAAAAVAVIGLALGPLAWYRERRYVLAAPGMGLCCLALTWQYVLFGIMAGAAAAAFLVVLAILARAAT